MPNPHASRYLHTKIKISTLTGKNKNHITFAPLCIHSQGHRAFFERAWRRCCYTRAWHAASGCQLVDHPSWAKTSAGVAPWCIRGNRRSCPPSAIWLSSPQISLCLTYLIISLSSQSHQYKSLRGIILWSPPTFPDQSSFYNLTSTQYLTPRTYPLGHHPWNHCLTTRLLLFSQEDMSIAIDILFFCMAHYSILIWTKQGQMLSIGTFI